ncbi:3'-5' exonuclease [Pectobacterium odoriferum]|uniref:3'-5' exonuclease n=1 Tax=Pectobacterium odoriferum TaxID=78398 RepID=UPI0013746C40|nr:3'-5' exonuclease [Pectobacterium odoriferum]QHP79829.1 3'-5' exonuclease [Pectobacterium odoriferum]
MNKNSEVFISVDIETSGPIVGEHSMLTLGACLAYKPDVSFSIMLKPISDRFVAEALEVSDLTLAETKKKGVSPAEAMTKFSEWIEGTLTEGCKPVFVGLNAPFDWGFVNFYFLKYLGKNPFGFTALDIKALFMGVTGCSWGDTRSSAIDAIVKPSKQGDHNALHDAQYQAELFRSVYEMSKKK